MLEARSINLCLPSIDPLHFQIPRNVSFNDKLAYMLIFYQPPAFLTMNASYQIDSKRQQHEIPKSRQKPPKNNKKQPKGLMQTQQRSVRHKNQFDKSPSHRSLRTVELQNVLKHQSKIKNKSHKSIFNQSQSDYQQLLEDLNFLQQFSQEHQQNNQQLQSKPLRVPQVDFKHDESSLFELKQSNDNQRHPTVRQFEKQNDQNDQHLISNKCHAPRQIIYSPRTLKSYRFNSSNQIQFMRKNRLHKLSWVLGQRINYFLAQSFRNIYCYAEIPKKTTCQTCQRQLIEDKRQKTCPCCKIKKKPKHKHNFRTNAN